MALFPLGFLLGLTTTADGTFGPAEPAPGPEAICTEPSRDASERLRGMRVDLGHVMTENEHSDILHLMEKLEGRGHEHPESKQGPSRLEPIVGAESFDDGRVLAFTEHAVMESFDAGQSWFRVPVERLQGDIRRLVYTPAATFLEQGDGKILVDRSAWYSRYEVLAPSFSPSRQPEFDHFMMDFTQALRRRAALPFGPLSCMAQAAEGFVQVQLGSVSCIGASEETLAFTWDVNRAMDECQGRMLPVHETRMLLQRLAQAVERPDDGGHDDASCSGLCIFSRSVSFTWQCNDGPVLQADFQEDHCPKRGVTNGPAHRVHQIFDEVGKTLSVLDLRWCPTPVRPEPRLPWLN